MKIVSQAPASVRLRSACACFRRAEFGSDFVSYDVLSPLHARRLLRTVLANADDYMIERIHVLAPVAWIWCAVETGSGSRRVLALQEPEYQLDLRPRPGAAVAAASIMKDAEPHLGLKDFPAHVTLVPAQPPTAPCLEQDWVDLGWLPVALSPQSPRKTIYQRLRMRGGIIDLHDQDGTMRAC